MKKYNRFFEKLRPDCTFVPLGEEDILIEEIGFYGIYSSMCEPYIALVNHSLQKPESQKLKAIAYWEYSHPETLIKMIKENLFLISD